MRTVRFRVRDVHGSRRCWAVLPNFIEFSGIKGRQRSVVESVERSIEQLVKNGWFGLLIVLLWYGKKTLAKYYIQYKLLVSKLKFWEF